MKIITEPSVYLVGKSAVNDAELDRFLADNDLSSWQTDTEVGGEKLVEVAGRLCYMSFAKPRPGGNKAYINHILEVGHGCYDGETDVLTADGWKRWQDVRMTDRFATRDEFGRISYHRPIRLIRAQYQGRMYRVECRGVDLLVTPNHRMYVCPTTTKDGRKREAYQFIRADELDETSHAYIKTGEWNPPSPRNPHQDVARLLGFAIGDGSLGERGLGLRFRLRRPRKMQYLESLAASLGWKLRTDGERYVVTIPPEYAALFRGIYGPDRSKRIPQYVLTEWDFNTLLALYQGMMEADGHRGQTNDSYDTTSQVLAGQFQQLCLHLGVAANVCYTIEKVPVGGGFGKKPLTRLSVITRNLRPEVNKFSGQKGRSSWIEDWEGEVYCAEVPNGTLYVRRNGQPVWCGNSVLEHSVYNLLITGVSRSLTHELVRHRAGMGYSQLSQRFVDESDTDFVVPPILVDDVVAGQEFYERHAENHNFDDYSDAYDRCWAGENTPKSGKAILNGLRWLSWMERSASEYAFVAKLLEDKLAHISDATARRKAAREAARSVLPNATETRIFVTGNARALRHFIEMRGDVAADAEIRRLAVAVLKLLQADSPNLFGDYEVVTADAKGSQFVVTDYRKV